MAALNKTETQALRDLEALLEQILKHGYDPEKAASKKHIEQIWRKGKLKDGKDALRTIITMKGYYSS